MVNHLPRPRGAIALGSILLVTSCDSRIAPSSAARGHDVAAVTVSGGAYTFENFELGAAPGTVCPGSAGCTNGAAEPMIRADATGTFYVSSELGVTSGTLAWKSTDGGLHYTALDSPNQISQALGGLGPGGGGTDLDTAPAASTTSMWRASASRTSRSRPARMAARPGARTSRAPRFPAMTASGSPPTKRPRCASRTTTSSRSTSTSTAASTPARPSRSWAT